MAEHTRGEKSRPPTAPPSGRGLRVILIRDGRLVRRRIRKTTPPA